MRTPLSGTIKSSLRSRESAHRRSPASSTSDQIVQMQQTVGNKHTMKLLGNHPTIQRVKGTTNDADKRKRVDVPFGYGMSGSLDSYNFYSSNFNSCNAVSMFNEKTKEGGLFHLLGSDVKNSSEGLSKMFSNVMPTQINLYNGFYQRGNLTENSEKGFEQGWQEDHEQLKKLFSTLEKDLKYSEKNMKLTIETDDKEMTGSLTTLMNDDGKYQGEKSQKGKEFISTPMDTSITKNAVDKASKNNIPIYETEKSGKIIDTSIQDALVAEQQKQYYLSYMRKSAKAREDNDDSALDEIYLDLNNNKLPMPYNDFVLLTSINYKARIVSDFIETLIMDIK